MEYYDTFELVEDTEQDCIGSRREITQKEKHDRQETKFKAQLVAWGFQERDRPQSDSPKVAKKSLKF